MYESPEMFTTLEKVLLIPGDTRSFYSKRKRNPRLFYLFDHTGALPVLDKFLERSYSSFQFTMVG